MYLQANIGRGTNVDGPLTDSEWSDFKSDVSEVLAYAARDVIGSDDFTIEIHEGQGHWLDRSEISAHVSLFADHHLSGPDGATAMAQLERDLSVLAQRYHQDAIALIKSSRLVKAAKPTDSFTLDDLHDMTEMEANAG